MKKIVKLTIISLIFSALNNVDTNAQIGDSGFFGGITESSKLPKTTEIMLQAATANKKTPTKTFIYKEVIFLDGRAVEAEGILTKSSSGGVVEGVPVGTYKETYVIKPNSTAGVASIDRNIVFNVNYRVEGTQVIKDYTVNSWKETITTPGGSFELDPKLSDFNISIIEDHTPGVVYYKGNTSQHAVYGSDETKTIHDITNSFYGYDNAWSSTETHRNDGIVYSPDNWQMQYQVRPSVSVYKDLQYDKNEPTAISFSGNYKEVMQNNSGLKYDILVKPLQFFDEPNSGASSITTFNTFEQLIEPDLNFLKGHWAESDIKKLFAMQILEGDPSFYLPDQAITRGDFITALTKAIKLPIKLVNPTAPKATINIVFPDVTNERLNYPYIMAAYYKGIAIGRESGYFYNDSSIEMEEVIVTILRTIGLQNLGLEPTTMTPFADDKDIAVWAKKEVYAAKVIGLIDQDANGKINPKALVTKAEAAAMLNKLIDYMRADLSLDYADHIVNFVDN